MKSIAKSLYGALIVFLSLAIQSCSSDEEPIQEYTGPWQIIYYEDYNGMHNTSAEFVSWFDAHLNCFSKAHFVSWSGTQIMNLDAAEGDYIELGDYSKFSYGQIEWVETIAKANEDEIKARVSSFEALSVSNDRDKIYDSFTAEYQKVKAK